MLKALIGILGGRVLQESGVPVLVNLRPFDVALQLRNITTPVDTSILQDVVTGWMKDGFEDVINRLGAERFSDFDSIFLTTQEPDVQQSTLIAPFSGVSVWKTTEGTETPNEGLVASMQLETTRQAEMVLLPLLQDQSLTMAGLGGNVENVTVDIISSPPPTPSPTTPETPPSTPAEPTPGPTVLKSTPIPTPPPEPTTPAIDPPTSFAPPPPQPTSGADTNTGKLGVVVFSLMLANAGFAFLLM